MKITYLVIGLIVGILAGYFLHSGFDHVYSSPDETEESIADEIIQPKERVLVDSLEAVIVAPSSHHIVYEDSVVRILKVKLEPNETEPIHHHPWESIMWFAESTPMTYYQYERTNNGLALLDSILIPQFPKETLDQGQKIGPEDLHAVKNTGTKSGIAYRVEFKKYSISSVLLAI